MRLEEFDYNLAKELIAKYPIHERQKARLMVLDRRREKIYDRVFEDIVDYFEEGDVLVLNDTKVISARLFGKRKTGGKVEIFLLAPLEKNSLTGLEGETPVSEVLLRPSKRLKEGERVVLESGDEIEVLGKGHVGRFVKFSRPLDKMLEEYGHTPLPPYIKRADDACDKERYQTVYAKNAGATASPTAGLHFTKELLQQIKNKGVGIFHLTLHTSYGTFAPVKVEDIEEHRMHAEYFNMSKETAKIIFETKKKGKKVFAVGTTTTRVLEYCADKILSMDYGLWTMDYFGYTDLFIYPSHEFKVADCLITNFHLPKSTLLILVSAFAGKDFVFEAYRHAIRKKYRFFSYGDAMLII